jgi:hypothetical protein
MAASSVASEALNSVNDVVPYETVTLSVVVEALCLDEVSSLFVRKQRERIGVCPENGQHIDRRQPEICGYREHTCVIGRSPTTNHRLKVWQVDKVQQPSPFRHGAFRLCEDPGEVGQLVRDRANYRVRGVDGFDGRFYGIGALSSAIHGSARWHHAGFGLNGIGSLNSPLSCVRVIAAALRPTGPMLP